MISVCVDFKMNNRDAFSFFFNLFQEKFPICLNLNHSNNFDVFRKIRCVGREKGGDLDNRGGKDCLRTSLTSFAYIFLNDNRSDYLNEGESREN